MLGFHCIVEVQPNRQLDDWPSGAAGAFVHTLGLAASESHFKDLVVQEFDSDGFTVIGWDDVMSFDVSVNDWEYEYAQELHEHLCPQFRVQYSKFDAYPRDRLDG